MIDHLDYLAVARWERRPNRSRDVEDEGLRPSIREIAAELVTP